MALPENIGDEWKQAGGTQWEGKTVDLIGGGTRKITDTAYVSVGGTTYVIWPFQHGVGTS